ncbi:MAG: HAD family hydrolase [Clostridia bacterium]|nr:HAD family hydrolase [Clostridia bacterium]
MKTTTVLFDLDGTLLPMNQDEFVKAYFGSLAKKLAPHGYDPDKLIPVIWTGTKEMIKNSGEKTNEAAFWTKFCEIFGERAIDDEPLFARFYEEDFDKVQAVCGFSEKSAEIIHFLKEKGVNIALATNPIFPSIATKKRIRWAGLAPEDFAFFTTYENAHYSKPNLKYYKEVLNNLGVTAEECLMVGNDVDDDMVAENLGMKVFLLTDCLINKSGKDISAYPQGDMNELLNYLKANV